jgi:hypothetical protein
VECGILEPCLAAEGHGVPQYRWKRQDILRQQTNRNLQEEKISNHKQLLRGRYRRLQNRHASSRILEENKNEIVTRPAVATIKVKKIGRFDEKTLEICK